MGVAVCTLAVQHSISPPMMCLFFSLLLIWEAWLVADSLSCDKENPDPIMTKRDLSTQVHKKPLSVNLSTKTSDVVLVSLFYKGFFFFFLLFFLGILSCSVQWLWAVSVEGRLTKLFVFCINGVCSEWNQTISAEWNVCVSVLGKDKECKQSCFILHFY